MNVYKIQVEILVEGETPILAIQNAFEDLEYISESGNICGYGTPKSGHKPVLYKTYPELETIKP
jgi:hypothetical protein